MAKIIIKKLPRPSVAGWGNGQWIVIAFFKDSPPAVCSASRTYQDAKRNRDTYALRWALTESYSQSRDFCNDVAEILGLDPNNNLAEISPFKKKKPPKDNILGYSYAEYVEDSMTEAEEEEFFRLWAEID
jgi:hypothetical protein